MDSVKKKAWFLDRDGTIIADKHYLKDPNEVVLLDKAVEALREAQNAGYLLIIITNQSGIARRFFTVEEADLVDKRLKMLLERQGVYITRTYRCPHLPDGKPPYNIICDCRKPNVGLFRQAIADYKLDPASCIACGDKTRDIQRLPELGIPKGNLGIIDAGCSSGSFPNLLAFFHAVTIG